MKNKHNTLPNTIFHFIWHFLSEFKPAVLFYILLSLLAGLWGPFNSILVKNVINLLPQVKTADTSILFIPVGLIVLNFLVFDNITWRTLNYICAKYTPLIINNMLRSTMNYVLGHSHQFFQDNLSGKISKQINNLGDGTERMITFGSANFLRGTSLLLAAFITAYFVHPIFCLVMITWFVIFASASMFMSKKLVQLADAKAEAEASVIGELVDTISNQSNVRFFARKNMKINE